MKRDTRSLKDAEAAFASMAALAAPGYPTLYRGRRGASWRLLFVPAVFMLPCLGLLALAGATVAARLSALQAAVVAGSRSALGAPKMRIRMPVKQATGRVTAPGDGDGVGSLHGTADEGLRGRGVPSSLSASPLETWRSRIIARRARP